MPGRERNECSSTQLPLLPHRAIQEGAEGKQGCSQTHFSTAQALSPHVNLDTKPTQGTVLPQEPET